MDILGRLQKNEMCHATRPTVQKIEEKDVKIQRVPEGKNENYHNTIRIDSWTWLRKKTLYRNARIHRGCLVRGWQTSDETKSLAKSETTFATLCNFADLAPQQICQVKCQVDDWQKPIAILKDGFAR